MPPSGAGGGSWFGSSPRAWELYDIVDDRTELHDLAPAHPDVVADLAADWDRWAERVGVIPWDRMLTTYAREGRPPLLAEE